MSFLESQLEKRPVLTIVLLAGVGVAVLAGLGILAPISNAVASLKAKFMPSAAPSVPTGSGN